MRLSHYHSFLKKRDRMAHKGIFGHVLVIGGDKGMSGAPRMAAEAALRVGAGLVSVATHPAHAEMINTIRPEIMGHGVQSAHAVRSLIQKASVIVVGPGLGIGRWSQSVWVSALNSQKKLILDADALNLLAKKKQSVALDWILTPHPAEAARLLKTTVEKIQSDRYAAVCALQKKWGGVVVLKGAGTLIKGPLGDPVLCTAGNPGMATAGMGDMLSGVIGGLLAQGMPTQSAAELGVLVHALAGDSAAREGGERGMIATDLLPFLRQWVNLS